LSLAVQKEDVRVRDLINLGKQRGYVSFEEVNDTLPTETRASADIDTLFSELEHENVPVYEDAPVAKTGHPDNGDLDSADPEAAEGTARGEEPELDETVHIQDKTNDPVRLYLR